MERKEYRIIPIPADEALRLQGFNYNVQVWTLIGFKPYYQGEGKYCRDLQEALDYIKKQESAINGNNC